MREFILFRHGIALDRAVAARQGLADAERPLTAKGRAHTAAAAAGLATFTTGPDRILTSPLLRARETADLLAAAWGEPPVTVCTPLAPDAGPAALDEWLLEYAAPRVALVGHEPDQGAWLARAVCDTPGRFHLKKAGAAIVRLPDGLVAGTGELRALLPPAVLRGLAGGPP